MARYDVILSPVITEKTSGTGSSADKFVFKVASSTNKVEVAKNFEALFGVKPTKVCITKTYKKFRPRDGALKKHVTKRAVITVPTGASVDLTAIK